MERSLTFQCETLLNFERICLSPVFTIIRSKLLQKIRSWYLSFAIFCSYAYAITPFVLGYGFKRLHQHESKPTVSGVSSDLLHRVSGARLTGSADLGGSQTFFALHRPR